MLTVLLFLFSPLIYVTLRFFYITFFKWKKPFSKKKAKTIIVMGSGGHTMEMIMLLKTLNPDLYEPRMYMVADVDFTSEHKIKELEREFQKVSRSKYEIVKIPRSRSVNQDMMSSVVSTVQAFLACYPIVNAYDPDVVLTNGPGTCVPACLAAYALNCAFLKEIRIIYVESVCRVKTLSVTGKVMLYIADLIFVQWDELKKQYPKTILLKQSL